jgi:DNA-binding FadR family transcriptional regulator
MVSKALKPTTGNADQITMNIVSVTSATSRPRSPSADASAARPGEGPVNPVAGSAAPGAGAGIASSAASGDSAHVGAVGEGVAASVAAMTARGQGRHEQQEEWRKAHEGQQRTAGLRHAEIGPETGVDRAVPGVAGVGSGLRGEIGGGSAVPGVAGVGSGLRGEIGGGSVVSGMAGVGSGVDGGAGGGSVVSGVADSALSGIAGAETGLRGEVGGFGGSGAVVGGVRFGSAARGEGVAARLTLADFARGHSGGLGPGAAGAMEMARSAAPSDAWLGQAGAAGSGAPEIAGMTGGQTNVGTASGAVPGIAGTGTGTGIAGTVGSPMRADEYAVPALGMGPAVGVSIGYQVDTTALSVYPRAAAQRGRGLHGQLVQQLGQMIVAGELGADRPLVPEEIGNRFEVSRTVVRESLRVLEAKGLVSARPNVGTRIRPVHEWNLLDPDVIEWRALGPYRSDQARELIELRQAFEPLAAHLVAARAARLPEAVRARLAELSDILTETAATGDVAGFHRTDAELHALLLRATDNRMLEHLATVVCGALEITGVRSYGCSPEAEVDQHTSLVDRVLAGDGVGAAEVVSGLLRRVQTPAASAHLPAQRDR